MIDNVLLFGVPENLAQTHVALIYNAQTFLFSAYVYTWSAILRIAVDIAILIGRSCTVELKVDPKIRSLLGFDHLLIPGLLVVQHLDQVCSVKLQRLRGVAAHPAELLPMIFYSHYGLINLGPLDAESDQVGGVILQVIPEFEVEHGRLVYKLLEGLEHVLEIQGSYEVNASMFLPFGELVFNELALSENQELLIYARLRLLCDGEFIQSTLSVSHPALQERGILNSESHEFRVLSDAIQI